MIKKRNLTANMHPEGKKEEKRQVQCISVG